MSRIKSLIRMLNKSLDKMTDEQAKAVCGFISNVGTEKELSETRTKKRFLVHEYKNSKGTLVKAHYRNKKGH